MNKYSILSFFRIWIFPSTIFEPRLREAQTGRKYAILGVTYITILGISFKSFSLVEYRDGAAMLSSFLTLVL